MFGESLCAYVAVYILYYTTRVMYVLIYYYNIGYRKKCTIYYTGTAVPSAYIM